MTALATLLDGMVDYAGLFPPAALPMEEAVARYAAYRAGAQRDMLARFVLPAARLEEFARAADALPPAADSTPWLLAVLAGAADAPRVLQFHQEQRAQWCVDTIEAKASSEGEIRALAAAYTEIPVYVEIPPDADPEPLIRAIGDHNLRAKIRTGGVVPEAFPSPEQVLRFLSVCVRRQVPFKATAGLHHPLRGEYPLTYAADAERGTMYGFLNVMLTAVLLHSGHEPSGLLALLEERDPTSIVADASGIAWRGYHVSADQVALARARFAGSIGSCSFDEPVRELAALMLLPEFP